jgi:hypothetical protein
VRVMMMIKGDREPGHLPGGEFLVQTGKYNEELSKAGVLLTWPRSIGAPRAFGSSSPAASAP